MKLFKKASGRKTRFRILAIFLIAGLLCGITWMLFNPGSTEAAWYNGSWGYRKQLVIDHNKVSGGADLSSFPLLVSLNDPNLNSALSSGNDILFTSSDGTTKLSHEIEKYEQGTGTLVAWVKIPTLSASTDTVIYLYWGNSGASNQQDATNVWDSNYKAVWHLNQANGSTRADSTSNANTLSENGTGGVGMGSGRIDGFAVFKRASSQYLSRTNALQTGLGITGSMTVSAWVNSNDITDGSNNLIIAKEGSTGNFGYSFRAPGSNVQFRLSGDGTATTTATGATTLSSNTWYYLSGIYDGSTIKVYLNGVQDGTATYSSGIFNSTANVLVGARNTGSNLWDGTIDEARVSNTARTVGWLATEYANQSSPSTFYTIGTSEEKNSPVLYWKFDDGSGTTAQDTTTYNNDGTLGASTATPTWQADDSCVIGKCLKFDGSNDYVIKTYASDTELDPGTASFSVSAWFRHPSSISGNEMIVNKAGAAGYLMYMDSAGEICGETNDGTNTDVACSPAGFNDSKWHHAELVKTGTSTITVYVDGKQAGQDASISATGSLTTASSNFFVGTNGNSSGYWNGFIDEVKYYDYGRTAAQVKTDFISKGLSNGAAVTFGSGGLDTTLSQGLVGYWKMDETSWATNCSTESVIDSSGNANDGAPCPSGGAATVTSSGKFGNAASFDGSNDSIDVDDSSSLDIASSENMSVSAWIKRTGNASFTNAMYIIDKLNTPSTDAGYAFIAGASGVCGESGGADYLCFKVRDGTNEFYIRSTSQIIPADSTWHNVIAVLDRTNTSNNLLYFDGQAQAVTTSGTISSVGNASNSVALCIGKDTSGVNCRNDTLYNFNGQIDDLRIYKRALSGPEARSLYDYAPGPIGYWKLDEKTGTSVTDSSGNGYTGTVTGNAKLTTGKYGGGVTVDNSTNRIDMGDQAGLEVTNMTLEAWYFRTGTCGTFTDCELISKGSSSNIGYSLRVVQTGGNYVPRLAIRDTVQVSGATVLNPNQWYHIAATIDGTTAKIYVNGILDGSASQTQTPTYGTESFKIGNGNDNNDLPGEGIIDEPRIYNYPRTAKQIISDMNAGHPAVGSPVGSASGWWSFDEGYGTSANDKSINANTLTLSTASWTNSGKFGKAWNGTGSVWLTRADDDDFDFTASDDFSISTWFKSDSASNPAAATAQYLISKGTITNTGTVGYAIWLDNSGFANFGIRSTSGAWGASSPGTPSANDTASTTTDIYDGTWHHLVATKNATSRIDLYIDGVLKGSDTSLTATGTLANSIALRVADDDADATNSFAGDLDELKIYRYALNADEVKVEYNQGKSQVIGAMSTASNGTTIDNSSDRSNCVPGDTSSCSAPVGEWNLDEGSSTSANDSSGSGLTGTLTSGPTWTNGKYGKAVNFDASDDDISLGTSNTLNLTTTTVEAWIYPTSYGEGNQYGAIYSRTDGFTGFEFEVINDGAGTGHTAGLDLNGSGFDITAGVNNIITLNTWQHVAVTVGGGTAIFYVNGKAINPSGTSYTVSSGSGLAAYIGSFNGADDTFGGKIDNVKVYNYKRSPAQIAWSYNRGAPIGWWKLDECTGTTANDSSGFGNNGTISIGATSTYTSAGTCGSGTATHAWNAGTTGKFNSALGFDGSDDYVDLGDLSATENQSQLSWSFWMNATTLPTSVAGYLTKHNTGTQDSWSIARTAAGTDILVDIESSAANNNNYGQTAAGVISTGQWKHITAVFDGTQTGNANRLKIYIDGKQQTLSFSGTIPASTAATTSNANIARYNGSSYYNGLIDDIRIFNYPLTQAQINTLYNENFATRFGPATGSP